MASGLVEPLIMAVVLLGSIVYYRLTDGVWYVHPSMRLLVAPLAVLQILVFALSLSFCTSVWQARARDVRFILRYIIGFWVYVTPIIYPMAKIPAKIRWAAYLNPLTAPVEMFKWAVLPDMEHSWAWTGYSVAVTAVMFVFGAWYFGHVEGTTVDRM
jgi:lipopolysaccharide transport system permease protein